MPGTATLQLEGLNIGRRLVFSFKERYKSLQKYTVLNHFLFLGLPKSSLSLLKKKKSMIKEKGQRRCLSGLSTCLAIMDGGLSLIPKTHGGGNGLVIPTFERQREAVPGTH